jgi:hypothetical protein
MTKCVTIIQYVIYKVQLLIVEIPRCARDCQFFIMCIFIEVMQLNFKISAFVNEAINYRGRNRIIAS